MPLICNRAPILRIAIRLLEVDKNTKKSKLQEVGGVIVCGSSGQEGVTLTQFLSRIGGYNSLLTKGSTLFSSYAGKNGLISLLFNEARNRAPCVFFFDEIEVLAPRSYERFVSADVARRVFDHFFSELDSAENQGVFILAATKDINLVSPELLKRFNLRIMFGG